MSRFIPLRIDGDPRDLLLLGRRRRVRLWRLCLGSGAAAQRRRRIDDRRLRRANGTGSRASGRSTIFVRSRIGRSNGPYLDSMSFVTGLKGGRYIIRQSKRTAQQVPKFRSDMTAPEIAAMLESFYRVKAGAIDFKTTGLSPRQFMGYPGFQFDFDHLDTDEVWRRGRAVGAVIDTRLYLVLLDGARAHYYAAALPDFEAVVKSARFETLGDRGNRCRRRFGSGHRRRRNVDIGSCGRSLRRSLARLSGLRRLGRVGGGGIVGHHRFSLPAQRFAAPTSFVALAPTLILAIGRAP